MSFFIVSDKKSHNYHNELIRLTEEITLNEPQKLGRFKGNILTLNKIVKQNLMHYTLERNKNKTRHC